MAVNQAREQGKEAFKRKEYAEAIKLFTLAVDMAASRPLWEMAALARDELAVCLCNRSAAFAAVGDWVDSYVDADAVVQLKRPWLKGHYRKGVALREMGRGEEAREALRVGLQFDPESPDLLKALAEVPASEGSNNEKAKA
ncbi:tetratricopeptide repeat domain-containing protein [Jaminaea rosea]|uniref:Tetratricopeptide repeat domain-containing protein n=1 Tax=Jaminaea rosea TaxID=1569628 RepID=A0A316URG8_9BASI|nr:tetratricopeptide repeat domain-containing protein [Jaminaea rosea]PWN27877.1 tetratricopeptide repeat domain-containing protein [Jaminaea rosea]